MTCLDIDSNVKFIASGLADGKRNKQLYKWKYKYVYVCTCMYSAGFVAVWNIEHQAKEFELKGMWIFDAILIVILFHPFPNSSPVLLKQLMKVMY